jgi:hypothetical protein
MLAYIWFVSVISKSLRGVISFVIIDHLEFVP